MGCLLGKKEEATPLRVQKGLSRIGVQPRAMMKLGLEEPHTQAVAGTWPLNFLPCLPIQALGYSAIWR